MARRDGAEFTPVELKILSVLTDGKPHRRQELLESFGDEFTSRNNLNVHLTGIRKVLRPKGQDIICELRMKAINYRWVRLLGSDDA